MPALSARFRVTPARCRHEPPPARTSPDEPRPVKLQVDRVLGRTPAWNPVARCGRMLFPANASLLAPYLEVAIRTDLAVQAESLYRICARTSGDSPHDDGAETNRHPKVSYSFHTRPSCRFSRLQGLAIITSPLPALRRPVPTRVLGPFRVLHVHSVGGCYQLHPLLTLSCP
jgi:hypothetical protein